MNKNKVFKLISTIISVIIVVLISIHYFDLLRFLVPLGKHYAHYPEFNNVLSENLIYLIAWPLCVLLITFFNIYIWKSSPLTPAQRAERDKAKQEAKKVKLQEKIDKMK